MTYNSVRTIVIDALENRMRTDAHSRIAELVHSGLTWKLRKEIGESRTLEILIDRMESIAMEIKFQINNYGYHKYKEYNRKLY